MTRHIGSFAIPLSRRLLVLIFTTPLIDQFGNYAQLTLGGTNTFRDTHLVFNQTEAANAAVYGLNINFYMLVAPRTDLPRIDNVYPNGFMLMQADQHPLLRCQQPDLRLEHRQRSCDVERD